MTAAAITSDFLCKNECPIQGHTFLPNNKNGIMLFHIMMLSMKTAWKRESVNLSSMGKRKVSTFLANEEKKRLPKSGKDKSYQKPQAFLKNVGTFKTKRLDVLKKRPPSFLKTSPSFYPSTKSGQDCRCRKCKMITLEDTPCPPVNLPINSLMQEMQALPGNP